MQDGIECNKNHFELPSVKVFFGEGGKDQPKQLASHLNHDGATRSGDLWTVDLKDLLV